MKKCDVCGGDVSIRNPTGKCDHLYFPDNVRKKKVIDGYMSKTAFDFIRFLDPSQYALSRRQPKDIKVLSFPRIYNMLPKQLQPTRPIERVKIRITIEEIP